MYIKIMKLAAWRDRHTRPKWQLIGAYIVFGPELIIGLLADILHNYTFSVLICLGLPPRGALTITARLQYYRENLIPMTWRQRWQQRVATFVCERMLNRYDPDGKHC
jgi:hypothetical protein